MSGNGAEMAALVSGNSERINPSVPRRARNRFKLLLEGKRIRKKNFFGRDHSDHRQLRRGFLAQNP